MNEVRGPQVAGESAADRLMRALDYRLHEGTPRLTRDQVAVVLHALADHTALMAALVYRPDVASPWRQATSVGRWLHDVGDQVTDPRQPHPFLREDNARAAADGMCARCGDYERDHQ